MLFYMLRKKERVQAKDVALDVGLRPASVFEDLHLIQPHHGRRDDHGDGDHVADRTLALKTPLDTFLDIPSTRKRYSPAE